MTTQGWIAVALLMWFPAAFAWTAARAGRPKGPKDRCALVTGVGESALWLAIGHALVPWDLVPPALWGVAAAIAAWAGHHRGARVATPAHRHREEGRRGMGDRPGVARH